MGQQHISGGRTGFEEPCHGHSLISHAARFQRGASQVALVENDACELLAAFKEARLNSLGNFNRCFGREQQPPANRARTRRLSSSRSSTCTVGIS